MMNLEDGRAQVAERARTQANLAIISTCSLAQEAIEEAVETPLNVGHLFAFLHHGQVESNKNFVSSSSKNNREPLNKI